MTEDKNKILCDEWFLQSDYDLETAKAMFKTRRYIYTVFMCHLSIEKILKGLVVKNLNEFPTKVHNLQYFIKKLSLNLTDEDNEFVFILNDASIPTRYPDDLRKLVNVYTKEKAGDILDKTNKLNEWLKKQ